MLPFAGQHSPELEVNTENGSASVPELLVVPPPPPRKALPDPQSLGPAPEKPARPPLVNLNDFTPPSLVEGHGEIVSQTMLYNQSHKRVLGFFFLHQFHDVSLHLQSSLVQLSFQRQTQRNLTILVHSHDLQRRRCLSGETAITLVKIIWTDSLTATEQLLQRQRSIHLQTQGMNTNIIHSHSLCKSRN